MRATKILRIAGATAAAIAGLAVVPAGTPASASPPGVLASFEGGWIDLTDGWGEARACTVDTDGVRCYRTETEMDAAEASSVMLFALCSTTATLYSGASYTGNALQFNERGVTHNLAGYSFDNVTSSYKIGACDARLYDTTSGGTSYPGTTTAGIWAPSMASGWDNRVGSIYID